MPIWLIKPGWTPAAINSDARYTLWALKSAFPPAKGKILVLLEVVPLTVIIGVVLHEPVKPQASVAGIDAVKTVLAPAQIVLVAGVTVTGTGTVTISIEPETVHWPSLTVSM